MLAVHAAQAAPPSESPEKIPVRHAVLKLIREVELPVREAGVIAEYLVREGEAVSEGQVVARMDDRLARRALERAQIELAAARESANRTAPLDLALKKQSRELRRLEEQRSLAVISDRAAENLIPRRILERTLAKADADLKRASQAREKLTTSVSDKDFDQYRLAADKGQLDVEQATFDLDVARLKAQAQRDAVLGQELEVESSGLEVENARSDREQARLQQDLKQADVSLRELLLEFQQLRSPIEGVVVERHHQPGEWLEPGERVLRIIHLSRLRAEAYLPQELAQPDLLDRPAELVVTLKDGRTVKRRGRVVHVGSEVDPVKLDVRIWVEVENDDLRLRPGMQGTLEIHTTDRAQAEH
jgi:multidrug efflux pump subunit AcrA (membrane-fusion protein)